MRKFILFLAVLAGLFYYARHLIATGKIQKYLDTYKDQAFVEGIQFKIGRYYFYTEKYESLFAHYAKFKKLYPKSVYLEELDYSLALANEMLIRNSLAIELYEDFLENYPQSSRKNLVEKKIGMLINR